MIPCSDKYLCFTVYIRSCRIFHRLGNYDNNTMKIVAQKMICFYKERDEISVLCGKLPHCFCPAWRASRNLVISVCSVFWGMQREVSKSMEKSVVINITKEHTCCRRRRRRRCCCCCCFVFNVIWGWEQFSLPYISSARRSNRSSLCLILGLILHDDYW